MTSNRQSAGGGGPPQQSEGIARPPEGSGLPAAACAGGPLSAADDAEGIKLRLSLQRLIDFVLACRVSEAEEAAAAAPASADAEADTDSEAAEAAELGDAAATAPAAAAGLRVCRCSCQGCDSGAPGGAPAGCCSPPAQYAAGGGPQLQLPEGTEEDWGLLKEPAATGATSLPWPLMRVLLAVKIHRVLTCVGKKPPRQLRVFEWERSRNVAFAQILSFKHPPLTLQRLCELLKVRDGSYDTPPQAALPLQAGLQEKIAAANAMADTLCEASQRLPGVRAGLFLLDPCVCGGGPPKGPQEGVSLPSRGSCSCFCCKDWLADLLQQQEQLQQKRYSSEGLQHFETEADAEQQPLGPSSQEGVGAPQVGAPEEAPSPSSNFEGESTSEGMERKRKAAPAAAAAAAGRRRQQHDSVGAPLPPGAPGNLENGGGPLEGSGQQPESHSEEETDTQARGAGSPPSSPPSPGKP
ncbi:hypothetical protein Efla_007405 [Eimeria flavescens]